MTEQIPTPDGKYLFPKERNTVVRFGDESKVDLICDHRYLGRCTIRRGQNNPKTIVVVIDIKDTRDRERLLRITLSPTALINGLFGIPEQKCILKWYRSQWSKYDAQITPEANQEFNDKYDHLEAWLDMSEPPPGDDRAAVPGSLDDIHLQGPGLALANPPDEPDAT